MWEIALLRMREVTLEHQNRTFPGRDLEKFGFGIIPTLALALDFSLKNALFDRFLFTKSR